MNTPEANHQIEPVIGSDIELVARRELAVRAVGTIAEVLGVDVSVPNLLVLADDENPTVRLAAKRALRCVEAFGRPDSEVVRKIGEAGMYDYVEGVMTYGASERRFLSLMGDHNLLPEEVTGLYAVRERVAEEINGDRPGFPTLLEALASIGIGPRQAASDPEEAVAALEVAGFFVDHLGRRSFDRPIFAPELAGKVPLGRDIDTPRDTEPVEWLRNQFSNQQRVIDPEEE